MDTKTVLYELRKQKGLSQEELAEKIFVSRQAVSRWENGETVPSTETLKLLSEFFDVSVNSSEIGGVVEGCSNGRHGKRRCDFKNFNW